MSTDFSAEPADRVPVDVPTPQNQSHHGDDSTDPEELWKKDERYEVALLEILIMNFLVR